MITKRQKILIVSLLVAVFVVLPLAWLIVRNITNPTPQITTTKDDISGDTLINGNTTPETAGIQDGDTGPVYYGTKNIEPLFGDNVAAAALRGRVIGAAFPDAKKIKISDKNVQKQVDTDPNTGVTLINVSFDFYLNEDTAHPYHVASSYNQSEELLASTITDDKGTLITSSKVVIDGGD